MPSKPIPRTPRWVHAVVAAALLAAGGVWLLAEREEEASPAVTADAPALPVPPVSPPVTDPIVPPPIVAQPTPPAPTVPPPLPEPRAMEHPLLSDNTNLSHARRAGLHRAANPLGITASAALIMDAETGEVLYERNELAILPIASLTKLMTGIVVAESKIPLDREITITEEDKDTLRHSRSRLRIGTELTRRQALQLALMSSENRAAHALARTYPGGTEAFVAAMNVKARELGMEATTFVDPTGLSNRNRSTASDVATLVRAAARHPLLRDFSTTERRQVAFDGRRLQYLNSNRLVRHSDWDIFLQKTGYIVEAGQCMALATRIAGDPVIVVLLDSGSRTTRRKDAERALRWARKHLDEERALVARRNGQQALTAPGRPS